MLEMFILMIVGLLIKIAVNVEGIDRNAKRIAGALEHLAHMADIADKKTDKK